MRAFCFVAPYRIEWCDVPKPKISPYGAILRPIAVSTCTSDIHTIFGGGEPKIPNLVMGHESVGEIVEVGELVQDFKIGDIVAVPAITPDWRSKYIQEGNSTHSGLPFSGHQLGRTMNGVFAEYYLIPDADTTLAHIPSNVSIESALMSVDVITTGFTGVEAANIKVGDTVCVIGIGPIGLMAIEASRHMGAGRIIAVGSRNTNVELAKEYGATEVISYKEGNIAEQVKKMTEGVGVDATIIAGGNDEVFSQAVDMTCYGTGNISNINYYGGSGSIAIPKFSGGRGMCGKTIHMELCKGGRRRIERIMSLIQYKRINPEKLITHRFEGFEKIEEALYLTKSKPEGLIKAMVEINW